MNETKKHYLAEEPLGKLLLKFSVPCVLSMLVSALYNIVDQIFIGQGVGYLGNAATNVVYPYTVAALALALLAGDGCAALLSLSLGRGEKESAHRCVGSGMMLCAAVGLVLMALGLAFQEEILTLFGVTESCHGYAAEYMTVITLGIPFYVFASGMNSVIRADGSPGYSMFATVLGAVLNLILDPVAIFALGMGVWGAAAATIIGQAASCAATLFYFRRPKSFSLQRASFRPSGLLCRRIGQLGISSFITQIAIVAVVAVANNMIVLCGPRSVYGADIPLSVVGIVMKVFGIVIAFSVGIAVGGQPIVGFNYGARNFERVRGTYSRILWANLAVGSLAMLLFEACPQALVSLFGNESQLYNEFACLCFRVFLGGILLCCIQKASSIFLQSIGKPVKAAVLSLSRDVVFLLPGVVLLARLFGVEGMLWAAPAADALSALLTLLLVGGELKKMRGNRAGVISTVCG